MRRSGQALALIVCVLACESTTEPTDDRAPDFSDVAVGSSHSCALDQDGGIFCWGDNSSAALGTGGTEPVYRPVQASLDAPVAEILFAREATTCALAEGAVYCWPGPDDLAPHIVDAGRDWVDYAAARAVDDPVGSLGQTCAIASDGAGFCWGQDQDGRLGLGIEEPVSYDTPQPIAGDYRWRDITINGSSACGVTVDGAGYCWGRNDKGQLGVGDSATRYAPTPIAGDHEWQSVQLGAEFGCGLSTDGTLLCWGANLQGQLANFLLQGGPSAVPVPTDLDEPVIDFSLGSDHGCAIDDLHGLHCWGSGAHGKTGTGSLENLPTPLWISPGTRWRDVAAGPVHTCGVRLEGDLYCWGNNSRLQLGDGTLEDRAVPTAVQFGRSDSQVQLRHARWQP